MNLKAIVYKPRALVEFSVDEIALLIVCAQTHYDGACRRAVECGAPLAAARNFPELAHLFSFTDLDTASKILENSTHLPEATRSQACELKFKIGQMLRTMNEKTPPSVEF